MLHQIDTNNPCKPILNEKQAVIKSFELKLNIWYHITIISTIRSIGVHVLGQKVAS